MELVEPCEEYAEGWLTALQAFDDEGVAGFWLHPSRPTDVHEYIQRTKDQQDEKKVASDWVPSTTYWLIDNGQFVGHVNIRHQLNGVLEKRGGHIGYFIPISERGKGCGLAILKLALSRAKEIGLTKALVTCGDDNVASVKIIERNGGVLRDTLEVEGEIVRRYWIDLL